MRAAFIAIFVIFCFPAWANPDPVGQNFPEYNGQIVRRVSVTGLERTHEQIVFWMLGAREGEAFDAKAWRLGIEHLYSTNSLYDIQTKIEPVAAGEIDIFVSIHDKWTLFPYFEFQGGGGSLNFEAGIFDNNLAGTLTYAAADVSYLDGEYSYDFNAVKNWILGSTYSYGVDIAKIRTPVTLQNHAGAEQETYTWARTRQQLMLGKRNGENVHLKLYVENFKDSLKEATELAKQNINPTRQYRLEPVITLWHLDNSEYLEEGHELTLDANFANPFSPGEEYHAATVSWKHMFFLPETQNFGYFLSLGTMKNAPVSYQFRLGGFDSVRGFSMNRTLGLDFFSGNFEYRVSLHDFHIGLFDVGKMVLQGAAFSDVGQTWESAYLDGTHMQQGGNRILWGAGFGVRAIFVKLSSALLRLDFGQTITPKEGHNISFGIGQFF